MPFMRVDRFRLKVYILFKEINAKVFVCLCVSIFADCVPYLLRDAVGFFCTYWLENYVSVEAHLLSIWLKKFKLIGGKKNGRTPKKKKI